MEPTVREAQAADATELARLYYLAGKSHAKISMYDLMVPGPYGMTDDRIDSLAKIITAKASSWLSYRRCHVVEVDGTVASGLAVFTPEEDSNRALGDAMMEVGWGVVAMFKMSARLKVWSKVDPGREPGYLIVENVATFEEFRGMGFTSRLLGVAVERARGDGHKGLQLTVLLGNEPAINVYRKAGFEVVKSREHRKFAEVFGSPGAAQMLLKF